MIYSLLVLCHTLYPGRVVDYLWGNRRWASTIYSNHTVAIDCFPRRLENNLVSKCCKCLFHCSLRRRQFLRTVAAIFFSRLQIELWLLLVNFHLYLSFSLFLSVSFPLYRLILCSVPFSSFFASSSFISLCFSATFRAFLSYSLRRICMRICMRLGASDKVALFKFVLLGGPFGSSYRCRGIGMIGG